MTRGRSNVPRLFEEYRSALEDRDAPRAIQAAVEIDDAAPTIAALLDDFATAIENDNTQLANTLLLKIDERYDEQAAKEEAEVQRAICAVENARLSESERAALLSLTEEASQANFLRSSFLSEAVSHLKAESKSNSADVVDTAEEAKSAEQNFEQAKSEKSVHAVKSDADLGSSPTFLATKSPSSVVHGEQATITVVVGNVGNAETTALTLEATGEKNASVVSTQQSLGTLAPDARREVSFDVTGASPGSARVKVMMKRNGTDIASVADEVSVIQDVKTVKEAITGDDTSALEPAGLHQAISYWSNNETVPGTGGKKISTDKLQTLITEWLTQKEESQ